MPSVTSNDVVTSLIHEKSKEIEALFGADVLAVKAGMQTPVDELIRDALEAITEKKSGLIFFIETPGGYIDTVARIVDTIRHHYPDRVDFIVPTHAYSAGTVLALSGDDIYMDYFSVLGPIDPQDESNGSFVPALGYVKRYNDLIAKASAGGLSQAETTLLVTGFDQAKLYMYEHATELSKTLLADWLPKYKFKDWVQTEGTQRVVTPEMRKARAEEIAQKLGDSDNWHSHGRGLNKDVLEKDLNLKIKDFGGTAEMHDKVRSFWKLLTDHTFKNGTPLFVYTTGRLVT